jgi:hypothetical protein
MGNPVRNSEAYVDTTKSFLIHQVMLGRWLEQHAPHGYPGA